MALWLIALGLALFFVLIWSLCRAAAEGDRQLEHEEDMFLLQ